MNEDRRNAIKALFPSTMAPDIEAKFIQMVTETPVPILVARYSLDGKNLITDPCPYCGEKHTHGKGYGHRISHCVRKSRDDRGYVLVPPI